jgi:hypothetical protein
MSGGRPSDYGPEIAALICSRLSAGESLREICRDENMPARSAVFSWLSKHEEFADQYARARGAQAEHWADEILDIADDGLNDWVARKGDDGETIGWKENGEAIQRSKLRVDTRKWLLSKLLPKKYGERIAQELSGPEGKPISVEGAADAGRAIAFLLAKAVKQEGK